MVWGTGLSYLSQGEGIPHLGTVEVSFMEGSAFGFGNVLIGPIDGGPIFSTAKVSGDLFNIQNDPIQGGVYGTNVNRFEWSTVPEPSTFFILGIAAFTITLCRRRI